ncbi:MAG: DUF1440 domain-containing protein [Oscillochloris sp.]|nr:DUF1440 domain-containing protein [Oscillochloris sp.]
MTLAGHFGYGTLIGALGGAWVTAQGKPGPSQGIGYGLLIWALGYAGWLPAARIVEPPWREPLGRTLQLLTAHVVWGLGLAWIAAKL